MPNSGHQSSSRSMSTSMQPGSPAKSGCSPIKPAHGFDISNPLSGRLENGSGCLAAASALMTMKQGRRRDTRVLVGNPADRWIDPCSCKVSMNAAAFVSKLPPHEAFTPVLQASSIRILAERPLYDTFTTSNGRVALGSPAAQPASRRDERIDVLRGFALMCIFFDHIPGDYLSLMTIRRFGFSDAAELFVFFAGYSAVVAYGRVYERDGAKAFLRKFGTRCLNIYAVHAGLFLTTVLVITLRMILAGLQPTLLAPIINDGLAGIVRGLSLIALPAYLDILPLYLVLLACFPIILALLRKSVIGTLVLSVAVYSLANRYHLNLPNHIDRLSTTSWTFNPFTWQLVYVLGAALATARQNPASLLNNPSTALRWLCGAYLIFAFLAERSGAGLSAFHLPATLFDNEPKCFVTPWRVFHVLALAYLALTSSTFTAVARSALVRPVLASGRHSLTVFAASCLLALVGRLALSDISDGALMQGCVNGLGLGAMLWLATVLDRRKLGGAEERPAPQLVLAEQVT